MKSLFRFNTILRPKFNFFAGSFMKPTNFFGFCSKIDTQVLLTKARTENSQLSLEEFSNLINVMKDNTTLLEDDKLEKVLSASTLLHVNSLSKDDFETLTNVIVNFKSLPGDNVVEVIKKRVSESGPKFSNLFVRGIDYGVTSEDLREFFLDKGELKSARIINDKETGRSRGFGFIEIEEESAKKLVEQGVLEFRGRRMTISIANERGQAGAPRTERYERPERSGYGTGTGSASGSGPRGGRFEVGKTVYVQGLDYGVTEEKLQEFFSQCGNVSKVRVLKTPEGQSKGGAFVAFENEECCSKAIDCTGKEINGRSIRVREYTENPAPRDNNSRGPGRFNDRGDRRRRDDDFAQH